MATNQACLNALQTFDNKDIEQNQTQINQEIENFKSFYEQQGVPLDKIFISAIISAKKIAELCQGVDFLTVQLAKSTSNIDDITDFKVIVSQCDKSADIVPKPKNFGIILSPNLIFNDVQNFAAQFMDANCCKHPPGTGA